MSDLFIYALLDKAMYDLKIYSGMNMTEDKPLYLEERDHGYIIHRSYVPTGKIIAIGLNGRVYQQKEMK